MLSKLLDKNESKKTKKQISCIYSRIVLHTDTYVMYVTHTDIYICCGSTLLFTFICVKTISAGPVRSARTLTSSLLKNRLSTYLQILIKSFDIEVANVFNSPSTCDQRVDHRTWLLTAGCHLRIASVTKQTLANHQDW